MQILTSLALSPSHELDAAWLIHSQDFGTYHRVDMLPEPDGIMMAVFIDDVSELNAPLLAVPGSHNEGLVPLVYRPGPDGVRREDKGWHTFDDLDPEKAEDNQCARPQHLLACTLCDSVDLSPL